MPPVISVVDDDRDVRVALARLLRLHRFVVHDFACAEDYLRSRHAAETACLITDVRLPGLSGIDLHARLVAEGDPTPVILVTAFPTACLRERARAAGAAGFFAKPFDGERLVDCVNRALSSRGSSGLED